MLVKSAAFLFISTSENSFEMLEFLRCEPEVVWVSAVYGPYQLVAYAEASDAGTLAERIEVVRTKPGVAGLDARMCKVLPEDEHLAPFQLTHRENAVLLIQVNYRDEKERVVTNKLREMAEVRLARAMWGPTDIVAVIETRDHESMRNVICDRVKVMKGVASNTTLYCYPGSNGRASLDSSRVRRATGVLGWVFGAIPSAIADASFSSFMERLSAMTLA